MGLFGITGQGQGFDVQCRRRLLPDFAVGEKSVGHLKCTDGSDGVHSVDPVNRSWMKPARL